MNINSFGYSASRYIQRQPVNNGSKSPQENKNGGIDTSRPPVILNPPDDDAVPNIEYNPELLPEPDNGRSDGAGIDTSRPPVILNPPDEDGNTNEKNPFDNMSLQDLQDLIDENINDAKDLFSK